MHRRFSSLLAGLWLVAPAFAGLDHPAVRLQEFIEPAPLHPEVHASTLVEASPGNFVAAWFEGSKEGNVDVAIWGARRTAMGWSAAQEIVRAHGPEGEQVPAYNPVLFSPVPGRLVLVHSAGWEGKPWLGFLQWSDDAGLTWSEPRRLPEGMRGPDRNKPIRLSTGEWLHPSTGMHAGGVHVEISDPALAHWRRLDPIADPEEFRALQPTLLDHGNGRLQMLCRSYKRELATAWSEDNGLTWSALSGLGITLANSAIDTTRLPDGQFLLVYNPTGKPTGSKDWGPRCPLSVAISTDGRQWRRVLDLETADIREGYAYPCVLTGSDGLVHLTYTWGRKRIRYVILDPTLLDAK